MLVFILGDEIDSGDAVRIDWVCSVLVLVLVLVLEG